MPNSNRIVLLANRSSSTPVVFNALVKKFGTVRVILEEKEPRKKFLQRRARKLGWWQVLGQVAFIACIQPVLTRTSQKRIEAIKSEFGMSTAPIPDDVVDEVISVNSKACRELLKQIQPDVVVLNGTRIVSKKTLECVPNSTFINMHTGITPMYRGVHGGYWSLANDDRKNFGVTIHQVDRGVDTGNIFDQAFLAPTDEDNFATYPYLQVGAGVPILLSTVEKALSGENQSEIAEGESSQYYHPTIWTYLANRIWKNVK